MTAATIFTLEAQERLKRYLNRPGYIIPVGLGTRDAACSIAAINIAINGRLTECTPECMSVAIARWILHVQDTMPAEMRNSREWKAALVRAAGTGRALERERERLDILFDWMWVTVLPFLQPLADARGSGTEWRRMCTERSEDAASVAAGSMSKVTYSAAQAADYAAQATRSAELTTDPYAIAAAMSGMGIYDAATTVAKVAGVSALAYVFPRVAWEQFDPIGLLERLVAVSEPSHWRQS